MESRHSGGLLFLQGPLGPFFRELAKRFTRSGYHCHRIIFNGGDDYYGGNSQPGYQVAPYTGTMEDWPEFLARYLHKNRISTVFLMGDCRYYHRTAKAVCERLDVRFMVFEEGYLRPNTITLEEHGVNALSRSDLSLENLRRVSAHKCESAVTMGNSMPERSCCAAAYYWAALFGRQRFAHYQHHRAFHPVVEGGKWLRGLWRKVLYKSRDARLEERMTHELSQRFFMVALQVHDDSQMIYHSPYNSVEAFIEEAIRSFARFAPEETVLILKHHPMDRAYTHYGKIVRQLGQNLGISDRLIYCHDLRLPSVYNHCRGVITVNSTVGTSALLHKIPVKAMGKAMYDIPGLTSQGSLDSFWQNPEPVDIDLFHQLQTFLFDETQINGSFFTQLELTCDNVVAFYEQRYGKASVVISDTDGRWVFEPDLEVEAA